MQVFAVTARNKKSMTRSLHKGIDDAEEVFAAMASRLLCIVAHRTERIDRTVTLSEITVGESEKLLRRIAL